MIRRINLLPDEMRVIDRRPFYLIATSLTIIYLLLLNSIYGHYSSKLAFIQKQKDALSSRVPALTAQVARLKETESSKSSVEIKIKEMERISGIIRTISEDRTAWADPLYEISAITPSGLWLTGLSSADSTVKDKKEKGLKITGMAFSNRTITDFLSRIDASRYFDAATLTSAHKTSYGDREVFSFEISCTLAGTK